jgi:cell division protein FtsW
MADVSARLRRRGPTDYLLLNLTLALLVIGVVMVFDASYAQAMTRRVSGNDGLFYLKRQAVYAGIGLVAMAAVMRIGYWRLRRMAMPAVAVSLLLLILVWIPGIGMAHKGAARWIGHGSFQFQPSEIAKIALVLYLSALLARRNFDLKNFVDGLFAPLCVVGVFVLLVEKQPDLGTAIVIGLTCLTLFFLAGARKRHLLGIIGIALLFVLVTTFSRSYRVARLTTFLDPLAKSGEAGYQLAHGLYAVGSGGVTGVGFGAGREKFYIPEANTDFIFATIAEETGLWGSLLVVGLLFFLGWRGFHIARNTADTFGALLASGIAALISWQALINVAVVTGTVPATGVPLPFVSYGGSSLVFLLVSVGILMNIAQNPQAPAREKSLESDSTGETEREGGRDAGRNRGKRRA